MNHRWLKLALAVAIVGPSVSGCQSRSSGSKPALTTAAITVAGRKVSAAVEGPLIVLPGNDGTTISFNSHTVRVEKDRALLDNVEVAKIPANATEVEVTVKEGGLSISANGTIVASQQLK